MPHHCLESDDVAALYVYRYGVQDLPYTIERIADNLGIGCDSFKMRLRNFSAIEGRGGLKNYAQQSRIIYELHLNTQQPQLRDLAFPELKKKNN